MAIWSVQDAKNRFNAVMEAEHREPQAVMTKHGKPAVVTVDAAEYARLKQFDHLKAPSFADPLLAMPADDGDFDHLGGDLPPPQPL